MQPSLQRLAIAPVAGPEPVVTCHGDSDDHLRIVVQLADALRDDADPQAIAACLDHARSWRSADGKQGRLEAFTHVLSSLRLRDRDFVACIVDPDALDVAPDGAVLWDDASARRERSELLDTLIRAAQRGGWSFVRPWPRLALSMRLDFAGLEGDSESSPDRAGLSPAALGIRRWLVDEASVPRSRVESIAEGGEGLVEALTDMALDELPPAALRSGMTLSALRTELSLNGTCGPLRWGPPDLESVDRQGVACLRDVGLLVPVGTSGRWQVTRMLRQRIEGRMSAVERLARRQTHAFLASQTAGSAVPEILERHFHAVQGAELSIAVDTALHYGSDLREVARECSLQGRYNEAAAIYQMIVERFDALDAYAWEYLGYNLARAQSDAAPDLVDRVELAYQEAHRLARTNPLFHGRLVGLRLEHRGAPLAEADRLCGLYRAQAGPLGSDWFGWQVVMALRRGDRRHEADAFQETWGISPPQERVRMGPIFGSGRGQMTMASDFDAPLADFEDLI